MRAGNGIARFGGLVAIVRVFDVLEAEDAFARQEYLDDDQEHVEPRKPLENRPRATANSGHIVEPPFGRIALRRFRSRQTRRSKRYRNRWLARKRTL